MHPPLEQPQHPCLLAAGLAAGQVGKHPLALGMAQLAVDQGGQPLAQVALHGPPPSEARAAAGWCGRRWPSAARSWARPRWIRLRTVPSLTPRVAAISSYDSPSMSHSTTATRYSGASASRAAC